MGDLKRMEPITDIKVFEADIPSDFDFGEFVAIDTETTGLKMFRDKVCYVQLFSENGNRCMLRLGAHYPRMLFELLEKHRIEKIFHYARFDLRMLYSQYPEAAKSYNIPNNIFCTKIASKVIRTYTQDHSLRGLCKEFLEIDLDKSQQCTNWNVEIEDLTEEQKQYAMGDVVHLLSLYRRLKEQSSRTQLKIIDEYNYFLQSLLYAELQGWDKPLEIFEY